MPSSGDELFTILVDQVKDLQKRLDDARTTLSDKLDDILRLFQDTAIRTAEHGKDIDSIRQTQTELTRRMDKTEDAVVAVRISFAERMSAGVLGGGGTVAIFEAIKWAVSHLSGS